MMRGPAQAASAPGRRNAHYAVRIAWGSIAVGIVVLALKLLAWRMTGSVALFSDALESIINVAAAIAALVSLQVSRQPADPDHPYGHHKAEYFSAVIEGVLIVVAAMSILREAYGAFLAPRVLDTPTDGLIVNGVATLLNAAWAAVLIRYGRRWRSPALLADGRHLVADVVTSVGVLAGVAAAWWTGWMLLDPILAGLVAINVLWTGWRLVRDSVGGLMDAAPAAEVMDTIRRIVSERAAGAIEVHGLRSRHAGPVTFIEFHLVVPGDMSVAEAHAICDRIEAALEDELTETHVSIHVEPDSERLQTGVPVL
jgi:cation diffusion facilitator family transporter